MRIDATLKNLNVSVSAIMQEGKFAGGELWSILRIFINSVKGHRLKLLFFVAKKRGEAINEVKHNGIEDNNRKRDRMHNGNRARRSEAGKGRGNVWRTNRNYFQENGYCRNMAIPISNFLRDSSSDHKRWIRQSGGAHKNDSTRLEHSHGDNRKPTLTAFVKILKVSEDLPEKMVKV